MQRVIVTKMNLLYVSKPKVKERLSMKVKP